MSRDLRADWVRAVVRDASFGSAYARPDEEMLAIWEAAAAETRRVLESGW